MALTGVWRGLAWVLMRPLPPAACRLAGPAWAWPPGEVLAAAGPPVIGDVAGKAEPLGIAAVAVEKSAENPNGAPLAPKPFVGAEDFAAVAQAGIQAAAVVDLEAGDVDRGGDQVERAHGFDIGAAADCAVAWQFNAGDNLRGVDL